MSASLVGSEMCIRDSLAVVCRPWMATGRGGTAPPVQLYLPREPPVVIQVCLLYTSDAADDM
eukprot:9811491-Alexandrium_andersonii.AAC.1